jgi:hypothetical protein
MLKQRAWFSVVLTLLALAIVYGVGTTFLTIELERRHRSGSLAAKTLPKRAGT